jgi:5-methylcytosine-specific restriction endonuclease McrA
LPEEGFYVKYKATGARFSECIPCRNAINSAAGRKRRQEDPGAVRAYHRAWRAAHPRPRVRRTGRDLAHRRAQAKEYKARNREKVRQWGRSGYRRNTDRYTMHVAIRRARERNAPGRWTVQEWVDLCATYGNKCLRCGSSESLSPDHVVPLCKGGSNDITNIQPLCVQCNLRKHRTIADYRPQ